MRFYCQKQAPLPENVLRSIELLGYSLNSLHASVYSYWTCIVSSTLCICMYCTYEDVPISKSWVLVEEAAPTVSYPWSELLSRGYAFGLDSSLHLYLYLYCTIHIVICFACDVVALPGQRKNKTVHL